MLTTKERLLKNLSGPDEKLLFSKAYDRALVCERKGINTFSDFLDPVKTAKFASLIEKENIAIVKSYGGAIGCERHMLGFYNEYSSLSHEDFPIDSIEIIHNNPKLTHRDFLGSVLGIGLSRQKIGDIFLFKEKALIFVSRDISAIVCGALERVSNTFVERSILNDSYLIAPFNDLLEKEIVISSQRLDAVISAIFNLSRGKSSKMIEAEKVFVNWKCISNPSAIVKEGDNITLRGFGRAILGELNSKTKNNNYRFMVKIFGAKPTF